MQITPFRTGPPGQLAKMNEIISAVNSLLNMTGDGMIKVVRTGAGMSLNINPDMVNQRIPKVGKGSGDTNVAKLFEIVSSATGPGIYNCLPIVIDSEEWDVEGEWDIFNVKQEGEPLEDVTETEQVLNLDELTNILDIWALFTGYSDGDWTHHGPTDTDYRCIKDHCAGGCVTWQPQTWTIEDRCRYTGNAYILETSDKTSGDTDPPDIDADWVLDNDEPAAGNNWENYWDQGPDPKLSAGDMILAFKVTDDAGITRLVGKVFGQNALEQFFEGC